MPAERSRDNPIALIFVLLFTIILAWRLISLVDRCAVNVLFMDQWDFYTPLFDHAGLVELFTWQHGPHRQGLGELLIALLAWCTHWNGRADAFAVAGCICAATLVALLLKWRLFGRFTWTDLIIPSLMLTTRQWESLITVPNPAHSGIPLLLLVLYAMAWTCERKLVRYLLVLAINFASIFTGFGFFLGLITPAVLLIETIHSARQREARNTAAAAIATML